MPREFGCTADRDDMADDVIMAETPEDAARLYAERNYPSAPDLSVTIQVKDYENGESESSFRATIEYEVMVDLCDECDDADDD